MEISNKSIIVTGGANGIGKALAKAFKDAVISGRNSYLAGRMIKNYFASASSPTKGLI